MRRPRAVSVALAWALAALVSLAGPSSAAPAAGWTQASPATSPPARYAATMAYDAARGVVVLFGGFSAGGALLNDTWTWNGSTWQQRGPDTSPPARKFHFMAYDSTHGEVVLFGGLDQGGWRGDTWTWDGTTWTERHPASSPPARAGNNSLADDPGIGGLLLFGGYDANQSFNDTWRWNGSSWIHLFPAHAPTSGSPSLATSRPSGRVILFGLGHQTWGFTGTDWVERFPAHMPPDRSFNGMSAVRQGVVVFGGSGSPFALADTWLLRGGDWSQLQGSGPPARQYLSMAYDAARGRVVLFGGYDIGGATLGDTWTLGA